MAELPPQNFTIAKGQDWPLEILVFGPEKSLRLAGDAAAGATSLFVAADHPAFSDGEKLLFGDNVVVTIDGPTAAGARSVTVEALAGPLDAGQDGQLLRDLTDATIEFEALQDGGDATPVISKTGADIVILTQTGDDRGKVQVAGAEADTAQLEPGAYPWFAWRRNSGSKRPIARGTLTIEAAGFL
jgi:hypothetical protein